MENTNNTNTENTVNAVDSIVPVTPATPVAVAKKKSARKSMKGLKGTVGAPPKPTNWPDKPFTTAMLFARNPKQCQLGLRNKIKNGLVGGTILALATKKQPNGGVGRPKSVFVLLEHFDPETMVLAGVPSPAKAAVVADVSPVTVQTEPVIEPAASIETTSVVVMEVSTVPTEAQATSVDPVTVA